ncbi:MAG: hypothetical protein DI568_07875 [Sphingomonas sp.]|nr:MAG: hypothetical protein DI568_07875 [Sphingomonas sp.]
MIRRTRRVVVSMAVAVCANPVLAGETAPAEADILVTAQRREQDIQDVPISMTALDSGRLADQAMLNLDRLGANVPNLHLSRNFGTSSGALLFMRGVGEGDSIFTNDPPVGIYVDDVIFPRATGSLFDLIDIERIEVLRGPQGTLYGRNTSGGAVRLVTKRPDFGAVGGIADVTLGSHGRIDARASLNLPLASNLALRTSAITRNQRGWGVNLTNGDRVNTQNVKGGRISLLWEPDSRLTLFATADIMIDRSGPRFPQSFVTDPEAPGRYTNRFTRRNGSIHNFLSADTDPLNRTDSGGASLRLDYRLGDITLSSISGYRALTSRIGFDQTANPPGVGANVILLQDQDQHSFSQELQLTGSLFDGRVNLVSGLYYLNERNDQLTAVSFATPTGTPDARFRNDDFFNAPSRGSGTSGNWSPYRPRLATDSLSGYASLTVQAGPRATLTSGLRYTSERKRYDVSFLSAPDTILILPDGSRAERRISDRWTDLSPRFAADYSVGGDDWSAMGYVSASKGFRSGSFDGRARNIDFVLHRQQPIAPETLWSYEAGVKSDWLDKRLQLNINYFINNYNNIAFSASRVGVGPPDIFRQNVGDARIQGLEAELNAEPLPDLNIGGWIATLSDRFTRLKSSPGCTAYVADERDLDLRFTPSFSYQARASYERGIGPGRLRIGGDYSAASAYNIALCNEPQHFVPDSGIANAQLRYEISAWAFTLSATNLFDMRHNSGSVGSIGYPNEPRQIQVQGQLRF